MNAKQQGGGAATGQQDQYNPGNQQQGGGEVARRDDRPLSPSRLRGARDPFELMARMDEEMDRLFASFWGGGRGSWSGRGTALPQVWAPQVEVFERDGKLHVHADLPGMKKEDVKLSIDDDQLVIQGERRSSHEDHGQDGYFHSERSYGSFYRAIPLPEGLDTGTAEASFNDGVLKVHFAAPQPRQARSRQLDIR